METVGPEPDPRPELPRVLQQRFAAEASPALERFLVHYYADAPGDDLAGRAPEALCAAAVAHWRLARRRAPGEPRIRVYNPDPGRDGWEAGCTVIDVVADDQPYLVDSISLALQEAGLEIHALLHPILAVRRDADGVWREVAEAAGGDARAEAYVHLELERRPDARDREALHRELERVLELVGAVVADRGAMHGRLRAAADELREGGPARCGGSEGGELEAFLRWAAGGGFLPLGYRPWLSEPEGDRVGLQPDAAQPLGILRCPEAAPEACADARPAALEPDAPAQPLVLAQSNVRAPVCRRGYLDEISVRRLDAEGRVVGEHRFLGRYAPEAHYASVRDIPILRWRVARVLEAAGYAADSHAGSALLHVLEHLPREELFQIDSEGLTELALAIVRLHERPRTRLLMRSDPWQRFLSCLVYVPRERFQTRVRERIQRLLEVAVGATRSDVSVWLGDAPLARIHCTLRLPRPGLPPLDARALEGDVVAAARSWEDALRAELLRAHGIERGGELAARYEDAFPSSYRESVAPSVAVRDIERAECMAAGEALQVVLYRPTAAGEGALRLKLFHGQRPATLADVLPVLERLGLRTLDEQPYELRPRGRGPCWLHDFGLCWEGGVELAPEAVGDAFASAFRAMWTGRAECDGLNRLVLGAGLDWGEVALLRAYARYQRQIASPFSQAYIEETLVRHTRLARLLVALFHARFDPDRCDAERAAARAAELREALEQVASLDEDRILRRLLATLEATSRTSHYAACRGEPLALKLHPAAIPELPRPVPWAEIFVYAPGLEGVHLRGGEVARGGIRWSERREDFRTEVLGLMKAQMVKNAAIVPVGAKGGFVLKDTPADPQQRRGAVETAYTAYIEALLRVTDNLIDGRPEPPARVVRRDGDDPYLVVAADKGTATFSDRANAVAKGRGFWLGDAFASGGSAGYDHKRMGITARGAWQAVRRHFLEMGRDIQHEPVTVAGIGDMSGDVFGNGMLLSRAIRLVAAFDHRHVIIDPDPDPERAYAERERLFRLPGSSWDDYDRSALSSGGGVYPRSAKAVALAPEARRALGIEAETVSPSELVQAVLRAPVDLLFNGGIGTYVKASGESHADVGDKGSEAVRVDARQLRCRVVGEGGNLGVTQRGRIELARRGGRINTDAIDNVGGVACSDLEVNIKILLEEGIADGELARTERDALLGRMTDAVAGRVLETCRGQIAALSLAEAEAGARWREHQALMAWLEGHSGLDRELEALPSDAELAERAAQGGGLTRPELAILLAHAKISAQRALAAGAELPEPAQRELLHSYFPEELTQRLPERAAAHRLRRALVATAAANRVVHRMGEAFLYRMVVREGVTVAEATRAWLRAEAALGLGECWEAVEAAVSRMPYSRVQEALLTLRRLYERATRWLLERGDALVGQLEASAGTPPVRRHMERLAAAVPGLLADGAREAVHREQDRLRGAGLPEAEAQRLAVAPYLGPALLWVEVAQASGVDPVRVAEGYHRLLDGIGLHGMRRAVEGLAVDDRWQARFRDGLLRDYDAALCKALGQLLSDHGAGAEAVERFLAQRQGPAGRLREVFEAIGEGEPGPAQLAVAVQELEALAEAPRSSRDAYDG